MLKTNLIIFKTVILLTFILNTVTLFAESPPEEDRTSMIGFSLGYTFSGFREETIFDVNRYLNTMVYSIHSVIEKGLFIHSHNISFFTGQNDLLVKQQSYSFEIITPEYYTVKDTYSRFFMEYSITGVLWGNEKLPGSIGGAIRADMYLLETLNNPIYINLTAAISLNFYVSQKWIINNKNTLVAACCFPVIGYALRPHYLGYAAWPLETGVTSFHNYLACFSSLRYYYRLNKFISLYSDLGFEISQFDFPKIRRDASLQIKIGAVYMY